jgi:hypothetical protein
MIEVDKVEEVTGHECHIKLKDGRIFRFDNAEALREHLEFLGDIERVETVIKSFKKMIGEPDENTNL